jgi:hypothetical protein
MANIQPSRFVLQSSNGVLKVDYETMSFVGQPVLNLTEGSGPTRHFSRSQIRRLDTEIGTLVTVTTRMTIDTGSTSFSVLIPAITLTGSPITRRLRRRPLSLPTPDPIRFLLPACTKRVNSSQ